MKTSSVMLQILPFCLVVLVSGSNLADLFSSLNQESDDTTRIMRAIQVRRKQATLPVAFSKILTGEDIEEEKKYECKNKLGDDSTCDEWKSAGECKESPDLMKDYCAKTCNLCVNKPLPAPPACQLSPHGCCWDGVTKAQGPNQQGCPECLKDRFRSSICPRFQDYCVLKGINREWVRQNCPASCITMWTHFASKTFPEDELKENIVYNAWKICYSGETEVKRDLEKLFGDLNTK